MKTAYKLIVLIGLVISMVLGAASCDRSFLEQLGETTTHEHTFGAWKTVEQENEADGTLQERVCSCGEKETRTVSVSLGLSYTPNPDGETCTVTGIGKCTDAVLNIPATIDGLRVTAIGAQAFKSCMQLKEVVLPDTVIRVENFAFFMCENLESITLSQALESIGESAFFCSALTGLELPATVKQVDILMIAGCRSLTSLSVAEQNPVFYSEGNCIIERESKKLVLGCNTSVIPEGVTAIAKHAFQDVYQLSQITLPESVTKIEEYAFNGCSGLTSITLSSTLTAIGDGAFRGCRSLESITIPEGVTSIGTQAFVNCDKLTGVSIPSSVTSIGSQAFLSCIALRGLTFAGTVEQWNAISFGGALVQTVFPFTVTCTDGTVNLQ